ncbi:complex I NDUFA9 subunit family protein [Candidatus Pelagibacter sp.]|nr:complex I NDUFA9 subunit family protein [Candidatus Pelagibacter sp.]
MKQKEILLFGATGQIGRNLIRKLSQNNYKITAVTRNTHRAGYILKTQANPGYLDIVELKSFDPEKIEKLIKDCDICINLVGILFEKTKNQFKTIHCDLPDLLSQKANKYKIEKFIHMSSLGIENAKDSSYAMSKLEGEKKVKKNFADSIILKPSIVYSVDDKFTTRFMTLLSRLPIMPIYYQGQTKFNPIHVIDLIEIIFKVIEDKNKNLVLECIGSETLTFKEIIEKLLVSIRKKRLLIPMPHFLAKISAKILQLLPNPLLTEDQLNLLKYDNITSGLHQTNFDLGIISNRKFDIEVNKYSYNWRSGGQFANEN